MLTPSKVYRSLEQTLDQSWPIMVALAVIVIGVTIYLLYKKNPIAMAAWLVYLYMP